MSNLTEAQNLLRDYDQTHLLDHYEDLDPEQKQSLVDQILSINFQRACNLFHKAIEGETCHKLDGKMEPIPKSCLESERTIDEKIRNSYRIHGLKAISEGRVAVLLLAGGQGTRLGYPLPKGTYSVGLPSGKCLFQLQAERIVRVMQLAKEEIGNSGKVTWYIMTSGPTNEQTKKFFENNKYFGLNPQDVILFNQKELPCFGFDGKILLAKKEEVALAPDGNGGIYHALHSNGILEDMKKRGVDLVHVHGVDNILVKVADPVFIGYCLYKHADCGAKVVQKTSWSEAVGVVCQVDKKFQVVEYSEISEKTAQLTKENGELLYNAGNICNHFFTRRFLEKVAKEHEDQLKLHVAKKKIPYVNAKGQEVKPSSPNGIKIEKFIFDVFMFAENFVCWEVNREEEFSALKNHNDAGKDCPSTARRDLLRLHKQYLKAAGGNVIDADVEISPLLSYAGENLDRFKGVSFVQEEVLKPAL